MQRVDAKADADVDARLRQAGQVDGRGLVLQRLLRQPTLTSTGARPNRNACERGGTGGERALLRVFPAPDPQPTH